MSNKQMKQALEKAQAEAKEGTIGGQVLDNGPADPAKSDHETPGGSQTAKVVDSKPADQVKTDWFEKGKVDGKTVQDAEAGAFKATRETLLNRATEFSTLGLNEKGDLHIAPQAWADGYGAVNGKVRKSEVRALLIAATFVAIELKVEGQTRKGDPLRGENPDNDYLVMETHSGVEWLNTCTGYAQLIKMAVRIKSKGGSGKGNVIKIRTELPEKSYTAVQETIKGASAGQASVILQGALTKMQSAVDSDRMFLSTMLGLCIRLDSSKDNAVKAFAKEIGEKTQAMIGRIVLAEQKAGVIVKAPMAALMAPAPAEAVTEVQPEEKAA